MSVEEQKQVETQQTFKEENSTSVVKTPLVDALRSYFQKDFKLDGVAALS